MYMELDVVTEFLSKVGDRPFEVTYHTKDGTERKQIMRFGAKERVKGTGKSPAHFDGRYFVAYCDEEGEFKTVNRERILALRVP